MEEICCSGGFPDPHTGRYFLKHWSQNYTQGYHIIHRKTDKPLLQVKKRFSFLGICIGDTAYHSTT